MASLEYEISFRLSRKTLLRIFIYGLVFGFGVMLAEEVGYTLVEPILYPTPEITPEQIELAKDRLCP